MSYTNGRDSKNKSVWHLHAPVRRQMSQLLLCCKPLITRSQIRCVESLFWQDPTRTKSIGKPDQLRYNMLSRLWRKHQVLVAGLKEAGTMNGIEIVLSHLEKIKELGAPVKAPMSEIAIQREEPEENES